MQQCFLEGSLSWLLSSWVSALYQRYETDLLYLLAHVIVLSGDNPLYIGMVQVGQHCSHTFGKSVFPWQYIGTQSGICLHERVAIWSKYRGPQNMQNQILPRKSLKFSLCRCCSVSVSTHISKKPDRVKRQNFVN